MTKNPEDVIADYRKIKPVSAPKTIGQIPSKNSASKKYDVTLLEKLKK